jgi:hypothetical protein
MDSDDMINRMNASHCRALLRTNLDDAKREQVRHLLAELEIHLESRRKLLPR